MKVLSLYYTHKPGGFCKRLYRLLLALHRDGHEVHYLTLDRPPEPVVKNVTWHKIPFPTKSREGLLFWGLFIVWCPLYSIYYAFRFQPERYLVFGAFYSSMVWLASLIAAAPVVLFLRSLTYKIDTVNNIPTVIQTIARKVEYFGMKRATKIICMTKAMAKEVAGFISDDYFHCEVIPNDLPSMNVQHCKPNDTLNTIANDGRYLMLSSGVLNKGKNIEFLLEAFAQFEKKCPQQNWTLLIAGDGPLRQELEMLAVEKKINHIYFLGWCDDMPTLYSQIKLVIHPSLFEGVPNAVLEPLSLGIPVLCSDIPEHRELLNNPELLFSIEDNCDLVTLLMAIASQPDFELQRLKVKIAEPIQRLRFNWDERVVEALVKL